MITALRCAILSIALVSTTTALAAPASAATTHPAPTIKSVSPAFGKTAAGTPVTITGAHFVHVKRVMFGSSRATAVKVLSSKQLRVHAPAHRKGTVPVTVVTDYGLAKAKSAYYYAPPAKPVSGGGYLAPVPGIRSGSLTFTVPTLTCAAHENSTASVELTSERVLDANDNWGADVGLDCDHGTPSYSAIVGAGNLGFIGPEVSAGDVVRMSFKQGKDPGVQITDQTTGSAVGCGIPARTRNETGVFFGLSATATIPGGLTSIDFTAKANSDTFASVHPSARSQKQKSGTKLVPTALDANGTAFTVNVRNPS